MNNHRRDAGNIRFSTLFIAAIFGSVFWASLHAVIFVEGDESFVANVNKELQSMREGKRGVVSQVLMSRLDASVANTTIRPLTAEEETWHPNDRRGTRSYVTALDTKIRGAERSAPTGAILYLHPHRVTPHLSVFRLGTLAYELAMACDLNFGSFSADFKIREKRAIFFRNAWCDAMGFPLIELSGRVATLDYKTAKKNGLLTIENAELFPILEIDNMEKMTNPDVSN